MSILLMFDAIWVISYRALGHCVLSMFVLLKLVALLSSMRLAFFSNSKLGSKITRSRTEKASASWTKIRDIRKLSGTNSKCSHSINQE